MDWIARNVEQIRQRLTAVCTRAGRDPRQIQLVGVTKGATPALVRAAWDAGLRDFGENRMQEAQPKIAALAQLAHVTWHLVGHLQTKKVKHAVELFEVVHSVDSVRVAAALNAHAAQQEKRLAVFLQVNVSGEASKQGIVPSEAEQLGRVLRNATHLEWRGLMTIAPAAEDPEQVRPIFRSLRELRDQVQRSLGGPRLQLSMGMSHDFAVAVEEGADVVRIGSAIFQENFLTGGSRR